MLDALIATSAIAYVVPAALPVAVIAVEAPVVVTVAFAVVDQVVDVGAVVPDNATTWLY